MSSGFKPKRSIYIAFGHDEEGQGVEGAKNIAKYLSKSGLKEFEFMLDEGSAILLKAINGVSNPVAM